MKETGNNFQPDQVVHEAPKPLHTPVFQGGSFTVEALSPFGFEIDLEPAHRGIDPVTGKKIRLGLGIGAAQTSPEGLDLSPRELDLFGKLQMQRQARTIEEISALAPTSPEEEEELRQLKLKLKTLREAQMPEQLRDIRQELQAAMIGEMDPKFANAPKLLEKKRDYEEGRITEEEYQADRDRYRAQMAGKYGMDTYIDGNTIKGSARSVAYPFYNRYASDSRLRMLRNNLPAELLYLPDALLNYSKASGVALIVKTADGKLMLQQRAVSVRDLVTPADKGNPKKGNKMVRGNAAYTGDPGASIAGMFDVQMKDEGRESGTPDRVTTQKVFANWVQEAYAETAIEEKDISEMQILGLAEDTQMRHKEVLGYTLVNKTAEEIIQDAKNNPDRTANMGDVEFEEPFFFLEADTPEKTVENITKLLTQVRCPIPPTHNAALLAVGYKTVFEMTEGNEVIKMAAADKWKDEIQEGVRRNVDVMNAMVREYYDTFPEAYTRLPERMWNKSVPPRDRNGYDPRFAPEEQGLPSLKDEFARLFNPETREQAEAGYLCDYEGTLDLSNELVDEIINRLGTEEVGEPFGILSARSLESLEQGENGEGGFIQKLRSRIVEQGKGLGILKRFFINGEKGGTWALFDEQGNMTKGRIPELAMQENISALARQLVEGEFAESMVYDETKQTMTTVEAKQGYDREAFQRVQEQFKTRLLEEAQRKGIKGLEDNGIYAIDTTSPISVDIQSKYIDKGLGADRFMWFLDFINSKPRQIQTFGDTQDDAEMADEISRRTFARWYDYKQAFDETSNVRKIPNPYVRHIHIGDAEPPTGKTYQVEQEDSTLDFFAA